MKTTYLIISTLIILTCQVRLRVDETPKAADLDNHFGTDPAHNLYGPKIEQPINLVREGVTGPEVSITPITNFSKEINPAEVVSGDLTNTAYDASKIRKAEIACKNIFNI